MQRYNRYSFHVRLSQSQTIKKQSMTEARATVRKADKWTDRQIERWTDRHTNGETDRKTNKW